MAIFDCDNHYYEALDAFTRHLAPEHQSRCVQWAEVDGRRYHVVGGKLSRAVKNPTFDPIAPAGAMFDYFRGNPDGRNPLEFLTAREPIRAEYRDHDARLATMDQQSVDKIWLFPTLGMLYEEPLRDDPGAVALTFGAFNRWLDEDWGYAYQDRIFAAPYLSLADLDWACVELQRVVAAGARVVVMRAAAPTTATGRCSPFDPRFDRFWALLQEAGIPLVVHAGDSGYSSNGYVDNRFSATFGGSFKPSINTFAIERAAADFVLTSIFDKVFDRFPGLRMASVENGSSYLADAIAKLESTHKKMPGYFDENPVDTLRRHWWINPFWEDDVTEVVSLMGADRVIFGSDWPHIEGLRSPEDGVDGLSMLSDDEQRLILHDNTFALNRKVVAA
jgi:predicted TIM-barrel fold metal-dependent hydrolase